MEAEPFAAFSSDALSLGEYEGYKLPEVFVLCAVLTAGCYCGCGPTCNFFCKMIHNCYCRGAAPMENRSHSGNLRLQLSRTREQDAMDEACPCAPRAGRNLSFVQRSGRFTNHPHCRLRSTFCNSSRG
jgi:hypothetical protein